MKDIKILRLADAALNEIQTIQLKNICADYVTAVMAYSTARKAATEPVPHETIKAAVNTLMKDKDSVYLILRERTEKQKMYKLHMEFKKQVLGFAVVKESADKTKIELKALYIQPPHKEGVGRQALRQILSRYPGAAVSYRIPEENLPARLFFKDSMNRLGYKEVINENDKRVWPAADGYIYRQWKKADQAG